MPCSFTDIKAYPPDAQERDDLLKAGGISARVAVETYIVPQSSDEDTLGKLQPVRSDHAQSQAGPDAHGLYGLRAAACHGAI